MPGPFLQMPDGSYRVTLVGAGGDPSGANNATLVDKSGSITSGGVAQNLAAANLSRRGYLIQNISSGDLWFSTLGTASAESSSLKLTPGQAYETQQGGVGTGAISIFGATTGQKFIAREW